MAQNNLQSLHSGIKATVTPGDPMSRMMGQYGKGHSYASAMPGPATNFAPGSDPSAVKGGKGGIKTHAKTGGLGAGPNGSYGSPREYGNSSDAG